MKITTPIEKTEEEKFKEFLFGYSNQLASFYELINSHHYHLFHSFWDGEFDSQEIANALGYEKSMALFQLSDGLQDILQAGDYDYQRLIPPKNVDFLKGKVIITDK